MNNLIWVGAGGAIGASLRYCLSQFVFFHYRTTFPLDTLFINFIGCFFLGCLVGIDMDAILTPPFKEFIIIGVLGGFTTFSAFSLESYELFRSGYLKLSFLYVCSSVLLGLFGLFLGAFCSK